MTDPAAQVLIPGYRCLRCGHEWVPREPGHPPLVCGACKSPYWDRPRRTPRPIGTDKERSDPHA